VALGLASAVILLVVHHFAITAAERAATRHAGLVASTLFQREVRPADFARKVDPARQKQLDELFRRQLLTEDVHRVSLVRKDGVVTYSSDHGTIGSRSDAALATEASGGTIVSRVSADVEKATGASEKTLETFAPVAAKGSGGAALIVQSYAPIHRDARSAQLRVGIVLEALLLVLFAVFVPLLARVTKRIESQISTIHFQAYYDELTGLPNRTHLFQRLTAAVTRAAETGRMVTVMLIDLDRFREINDTLGHETGDRVLVETASRLRDVVEESRLLARIGGDELVVVGEFEDEAAARAFAEQARKAVEPPISVDGLSLALGATVGMATFPADGEDAETLVKHAEVAMHTAKEWHRGVLGYSPAVDPHDPEQLKLAAALREAAESGQLRPRFQPKVDLGTNRIAGFEALVYWEHPTRGLLPPGAFIPVAERTGAIRHVTRAVLAGAVEQLASWPAAIGVAVNLTAIDLLDTTFPRYLRRLLDSHRVEPGRLCLELTESTVMADPDRARRILERIVATGARVAIDDFGTGHSSLAYLRELPVHEIKIDRSFITDMTVSRSNRMIVKATVQLAQSLGLQIVAEGVENAETHSALRGLGCDYAQGYLYGRALPADAVADLLAPRDAEAA
jgi:diguanylate cyclase